MGRIENTSRNAVVAITGAVVATSVFVILAGGGASASPGDDVPPSDSTPTVTTPTETTPTPTPTTPTPTTPSPTTPSPTTPSPTTPSPTTPPPPTPPSATCPWAVSPSTNSSYYPESWAKTLADLGVCSVHGFTPDYVAGSSSPAQAGEDYRVLQAANLNVSGVLQWSPKSGLAFPTNLTAWSRYVTTMVATHPEVTYWDVWTQPPNGLPNDPKNYAINVKRYAALVKSARTAARAASLSKARIGLAAQATNIRWLADVIRAGAKGQFDYITVYPRERAGALMKSGEGAYLAIVPNVRSMLAATSPSQRNVPVRLGGLGVPIRPSTAPASTSGVSEATAASYLIKAYALGLAQGAQQIAWFDAWDGDFDPSTPPYYGLLSRTNDLVRNW